jgi:outer membrane protein assembly factor BamB
LIATAGAGSIYLYNHSGVLQKTLTSTELGVSSSNFGYIIKLTEDYLFISNNSGSVYQVNLSDYSLERTITSSEGGSFGRTINASPDGSRLIVSAPYLSTPIQASGQTGGKVYVYDTSDGSLVRSFSQPASNGYILGRGAAEGNTGGVAVTSTHAFISNSLSVPAASKYQPVYVYRLSDGTLQETFTASTTNTKFGEAIAVSGNDLVIGAPNGKLTVLYRADTV